MDCPNRQSGVGENQDKIIIRPSGRSSTQLLELYEFLGLLFGICIRTGSRFNLELPAFFWKQLTGDIPERSDLTEIDFTTSQVFRDFESSDLDKKTFEQACKERFVTFLSDGEQVELKENGARIPVTFETRKEYVELAFKARIEESRPQIEAIRRGIGRVLPIQVLNLLSWQELELMVVGRSSIDLELLKRHTRYSGITPDSDSVRFLWQVLEEFSEEDRRKFVRFTWAQERLPADDEEFIRSHTRLLIKGVHFDKPDSRFPKSDTCFFNLELPAYSSKETLKERLVYAINHTYTMNADQGNSEANLNHPEDMFM